MKVKLLTIGKTTVPFLRTGEEEYQGRLKHYLNLERVDLREVKKSKNGSAAEQKKKEGDLIISYLEDKDFVVLLEERGTELSSIQFSDWLAHKRKVGLKSLVFIVGGAYGFHEQVYERTQEKISLSKMTFSHQMIRLLFLEQLYRANTILKGEKYHHT